jgi:hypothetical protein
MGDHATFSNPSEATFEKGKSKDVAQDMSMDEESSSESENEMVCLLHLQPLILHADFMRVSRPTTVRTPLFTWQTVLRCHMRPATNDPT